MRQPTAAIGALVVAAACTHTCPTPASPSKPAPTTVDRLVGVWTIASCEQTNQDGTKLARYGDAPKGLVAFDAAKHILIMVARADLPKIASHDLLTATAEEAQALVGGSIAYFGTYELDEPTMTLTLALQVTTFPNQYDVPQKRIIASLTDTELHMQNPKSAKGNVIACVFKRS